MDDVSSAVTTILDLSTLLYDAKHVFARKALVHQTDEVLVNVYILEPGGRVPAWAGEPSCRLHARTPPRGHPRCAENGPVPLCRAVSAPSREMIHAAEARFRIGGASAADQPCPPVGPTAPQRLK